MKLLKAIILMFLAISCKAQIQPVALKQPSKLMIQAVCEAVDKSLSKYSENLNLIVSNNKSLQLKEFTTEILEKLSINPKVTISMSKFQLNRHRKKRSTVIMTENIESLFEIFSEISLEIFRSTGRFMIVVIDSKFQEIEKLFEFIWKRKIINVNFMIEDEIGDISVKTFKPFNDGKCGHTKSILINKFKDGKFVNGTANFFPKKTDNLQNCEVKVSITVSEPFVIAELQPDLSYKFTGFDIDLITTLAEILNFKINYLFSVNPGFIHQNGTAQGPFKTLLNNQTDLLIAGWQLRSYRLQFFDASTAYRTDQLVFVVPPGRNLISFEQLVYPFKPIFWILILLSFLIGVFVILILKQMSLKVQSFVFGSRVKNPFFTMFTAFLTGQQNILPGRNFARYLLMMFMLYSLVIRSLYQGAYYTFLRSHRRHKEVQSINEMIERNFKIYAVLSHLELTKASKLIDERTIPILYQEDLYKLTNQLPNNPGLNYAVIRQSMKVKYTNLKLSRRMRQTICKEIFASAPTVFYTQKNFVLLEEMNDKIELLKSAGLMEYWDLKYNDNSFVDVKQQSIPLDMRHVKSSFVILVLGSLLSLILILIEKVTWKKRKKLEKRLKRKFRQKV